MMRQLQKIRQERTRQAEGRLASAEAVRRAYEEKLQEWSSATRKIEEGVANWRSDPAFSQLTDENKIVAMQMRLRRAVILTRQVEIIMRGRVAELARERDAAAAALMAQQKREKSSDELVVKEKQERHKAVASREDIILDSFVSFSSPREE